MSQKLLVVGGNGFVGSAICRLAVGRGWQVTSISTSGKPYVSDSGHQPAWAHKVQWRQGSALDPTTFQDVLAQQTAVAHTLGVLLEDDYKSNGLRSLVSSLAKRFAPSVQTLRRNPLDPSNASSGGKYEQINRDSAITMFKAFQQAKPVIEPESEPLRRSFVYISAEDIFRPLVPSRYISTKREAERAIQTLADASATDDAPVYPFAVRPSLIYHPHERPMSPLPATLIDISAGIQKRLPPALRAQHLASSLNTLSLFSPHLAKVISSRNASLPPISDSLANLVTIPPVHVDTVAESVCRLIESNANGHPEPMIAGVKEMRKLVGFQDEPDSDTLGSRTYATAS